MLFRIQNGLVDVYIQPNDTRMRGSQRLRQLQATKDVYKYSFYPRTINDWNRLPTSVTDVQTAGIQGRPLEPVFPILVRPYWNNTNMYIDLTGDVGYFICFIGRRSFMQGNRQSEKISALTVEMEDKAKCDVVLQEFSLLIQVVIKSQYSAEFMRILINLTSHFCGNHDKRVENVPIVLCACITFIKSR